MAPMPDFLLTRSTMGNHAMQVSRAYKSKHFKADMKTVLATAGVQGDPVVLFLEDHHLVDATFIEMINSLLSTGEIPGLYHANELEPLLGPLRDQASESGWRGSLFDFFVSRIKVNLHVVLSLDCSDANFGILCESNPALYNKCTMVWMDRWSPESMNQIPHFVMGADVLEQLDNTDAVVQQVNMVHTSVPWASPRHFVMFCHTYAKLYVSTRKVKVDMCERLRAGLAKLSEAATRVDELKDKAHEQSILLSKKQLQADQALENIQDSIAKSSTQRLEVSEITEKLSMEEAILAERKKVRDCVTPAYCGTMLCCLLVLRHWFHSGGFVDIAS